jgi:hypothetical protein
MWRLDTSGSIKGPAVGDLCEYGSENLCSVKGGDIFEFHVIKCLTL